MFRKINNPLLKLAIITAIGVVLNVICFQIVKALDIGIYLDTFGTVFISVLAGYVPGIAVGFATNLINAGFNIDEMYFAFISVLVALFSAFFASKGYYKKFYKVLIIIPCIVIVTSFFAALIEELVYSGVLTKSLAHLKPLFAKKFFIELSDKSLIILSTFFIIKLVPENIKKEFRTFGRMQAPLSQEISNALKVKNPFILSLRTKLVCILIGSVVFVTVLISYISCSIYQISTEKERERITDGITTMVVSEINPYKVNDYLTLGRAASDYSDIERRFYRIRASNSDIKYLYVYKVMEDGCHVIFDLETADTPASKPGDIMPFEDSFEKYREDLLAGRPIPPIISNETYGYLLTIYKPVYDYQGRCVCYAGIDFSMESIHDYGKKFIAKVVALFLGAVIFILVLGLWFIENNIILPVNTMAYCARNFAYDSEAAREHNIERIRNLNIRTNDEIENLYSAFLKTTSDSMHYFKNFKKAKVQAEVMHELAHKDAMTGLKNKTAYTEKTAVLDEEIAAKRAEFAIIMIDVNFLKRVNDTYGHEYGNTYLINAGKLTCSIFGEENVYRIGGDEFVAVLKDKQLSLVNDEVVKFRSIIDKFKEDTTLKPWEKVSAAVGVAYYDELIDKTAEEVFKRADADMYKNKLAMKAVRKD